jgi:phosphoserine phosphatase
LLEEVAEREGIPLDQVIAIGDGANDLLMLQKAGHGIAFHAKPKLREAAHTAISGAGLDAILYLLGIGWRDIASLEKLDPELGSLNAARRSRSDPPPR